MSQELPGRHLYRVVVADEHAVARRGIVASLAEIPEIEVCGQVDNGFEALQVAIKQKPDLIVLGLNLQIVRGLRVLRMLSVAVPEAKVLVVTLLDSPEVVEIALRTGARAVIAKSDPPEELLQAVGEVTNQRRYVTRKFRTKLGAKLSLFCNSDACPHSDLASDEIARVMDRAEMKVRAEFLAIWR
jgi:DNA-binding NarL/FixJ family response regulator